VIPGYSVSDGAAVISGEGAYQSGETVTITGLERNTSYHLYLRYAENAIHRQSDWSKSLSTAETSKTTLSEIGQIRFTSGPLYQGDRLDAWVESAISGLEGEWTWYQVVNGVKTQIYSVYQSDAHTNGTYIVIPDSQAAGTQYHVEYKGTGGVEGTLSGTSTEVAASVTTPLETPPAPETVRVTDTSIVFAMPSGSSGFYAFKYGETADESQAQELSGIAADGASVTVSTGIVRNKPYYVWSQKVPSSEDRTHSKSGWCRTPLQITSERTELGGSVTVQGSAVMGQELKAVYNSASYIPTGDDTGGTWQWERNNISISGANLDTYTIQADDIGKQITARYYANQDKGFKGNIASEAMEVSKKSQTDPASPTVESGEPEETASSLKVTLEAGAYCQARKIGQEIPKAPADEAEAVREGWIKSATGDETLRTDYQGNALEGGSSYVVYVVKPGDSQTLPSRVIVGDVTISSKYTQTGTVTYTADNDKNMVLAGGQLTATLTDANSQKGSWRWYTSATDYHTSTPTQWDLLYEGYYPINNSTTSTLSVTSDMLGKYIRAEFAADETSEYTGTADGGASHDYVKQIYQETISVEGKGYSGQTINIRIGNLVDQEAVKTVTLNFQGTDKSIAAVKDAADPGLYTCVIPKSGDYYGELCDGKTIVAQMTTVTDKSLYLDASYQQVKNTIDSKASTGTEITFKAGIPLATPEDLAALLDVNPNYFLDGFDIQAEEIGGYQSYYYMDSEGTKTTICNRDGVLGVGSTEAKLEDIYWGWYGNWIITDNIDLTNQTISAHKIKFRGILDGDFHTVTGQKRPLFYSVYGTSGNYAEIKNMILKNANINYSTSYEASNFLYAAFVAPTGGYAKFSKLLMVDAVVRAQRDVGMLYGYTIAPIVVEQCGSAKGELSTVTKNVTLGGMGGAISGSVNTGSMKDCFAVKSVVTPSGDNTGGLLGGVYVSGVTIDSCYSANIIKDVKSNSEGGVVGRYRGTATKSNLYYDKTMTPMTRFDSTANDKGKGLITYDMLGNKLEKPGFGSVNTWTYTDGFYPRLTWMLEEAAENSPRCDQHRQPLRGDQRRFPAALQCQRRGRERFVQWNHPRFDSDPRRISAARVHRHVGQCQFNRVRGRNHYTCGSQRFQGNHPGFLRRKRYGYAGYGGIYLYHRCNG